MKGNLEINGTKLNILHFTNGIYTESDVTGRPWGQPKGGIFTVCIPMAKDMGGITRAALHDTLKVAGQVIFYQRDFSKIFSKLEFANAHIINYSEHYNHLSSAPPLVKLTFSPGIQRLNNDTIFEKPWNPSNPFKELPPAPVTSKEKKIANYTLTDINNKPITEYTNGDTIVLNINTENRIGDSLTLDLKDKEYDFKHNGSILNNDILENITISSDLEKLVLEVIPQEEEELKDPKK